MAGLNNNQKNQNGGKREGAGRPLGSTNKPNFADYITFEEIAELMTVAKTQAMNGKPEMLKFMLEQIFGKAKQSIDATMTGELFNYIGEPLPPKIMEQVTQWEEDSHKS